MLRAFQFRTPNFQHGITSLPLVSDSVRAGSRTGSNNCPLAARCSKYSRSINTRPPARIQRNRPWEIQSRQADWLTFKNSAASRTLKNLLLKVHPPDKVLHTCGKYL
jgi:hypothetical protein